MTPSDATFKADGLLAALNAWHARQHGQIGEDSNPVWQVIRAGQIALDTTQRAGQGVATQAWRTTEKYAYAALQTANTELQKTLAELANIAKLMGSTSYNYAENTADAVVAEIKEDLNDMLGALWSRAKDFVMAAVPWVLLGGGILLLLAGGLPGMLVGAAALLGGTSMLSQAFVAGPSALASSAAALSI